MTPRTLLFIVEQGGYPLYTEEIQRAGYQIVWATSMRKALMLLKSLNPDVILVEFNFGPKYGDRISNLEPLLAQLQSGHGHARVIVFLEREHGHHLDKLRGRFSIFDALFYPLEPQLLIQSVQRAAGAN